MKYKALREKKIKITALGLPDGIRLREPGTYGPKQLRDILNASDEIIFVLEDRLDYSKF